MEEQRECKTCNEIKDVKTGYYPNRNECISCVSKKESVYRRKESLQRRINKHSPICMPVEIGRYNANIKASYC